MKIASKTLLGTAFLFTIIAAPLAAQNDTASEAKADNGSAAAVKGEVATNSSDNEHSSVRIDSTGVHVGGEDRVDINVPNWGGAIRTAAPDSFGPGCVWESSGDSRSFLLLPPSPQ